MAPREETPVRELGLWGLANLSGPLEVFPLVEKVTARMAAEGYAQADRATVETALAEALEAGLRTDGAGASAGGVRVRYRVNREEVMAEVDGESPCSDPFHAWIYLCARPDEQGIPID
jgi:hypothetical protein